MQLDPEMQALQVSLPMLQNILNGRPGQGVIDALQPQFQRNLATANQQGGRFGSGNAILRSRAVDDFNLLGANAAQQGQQLQLQAANALAMLSGQAGKAGFERSDLENQRRIQLLSQALGGSLSQPWVQTQAASQGWGGILTSLLGTGLGALTGGAGSALGGAAGNWLTKLLGGGGGGNGMASTIQGLLQGPAGQPPLTTSQAVGMINPILRKP